MRHYQGRIEYFHRSIGGRYEGAAIDIETKGGFRLGVMAQKWVGVQEIHSSHW